MASRTFSPNWCVRTGAVLQEVMDHESLTVELTAERTGLTVQQVQGILEGWVLVTAEIADALAAVGVTPAFWLNFEYLYRTRLAAGCVET